MNQNQKKYFFCCCCCFIHCNLFFFNCKVIRGRSKPLKKEGLDGLNIAEFTKESMFRKVVELAPDLSQTTEQDIRSRLSRKFDFDWRKPFLKIIPTGTQQPLMRTEVLNIIWGLAAHTLINDVFPLSQKYCKYFLCFLFGLFIFLTLFEQTKHNQDFLTMLWAMKKFSWVDS